MHVHTRTFVLSPGCPLNPSVNALWATRAQLSSTWCRESLKWCEMLPNSSSSSSPEVLTVGFRPHEVWCDFLRYLRFARGWNYFTIEKNAPTFVRFAGKDLALASKAYIFVLTFDPIDPKLATRHGAGQCWALPASPVRWRRWFGKFFWFWNWLSCCFNQIFIN